LRELVERLWPSKVDFLHRHLSLAIPQREQVRRCFSWSAFL
jgi:hypothetical protein